MKAKVIMNEQEWDVYKNSFPVKKEAHVPGIPPSFPVLVISQVVVLAATVWHHFIEVKDLRQMLGLSDMP